MLFGVIIIYLGIKLLLLILLKTVGFKLNLINIGYNIWDNFNIDCMAIGGVAAYSLFKKEKILTKLYNSKLQILLLLILIFLISFGITFPYINREIYAILFAFFILNIASNTNSIIKLENRFFNFFGRISYGIYMYHVIAIVLVIKLTQLPEVNNYILYSAAITLTIILATISYYFIEKPLLKFKYKHTKILSGEDAK